MTQLLIESSKLNPADFAEAWGVVVAHVQRAKNVCVLTGAGVSAESGLATFRGNGLWEDHRVEDVATPEGFERDPALVWRFYNMRREKLRSASPNPAHHALASLHQKLDATFTLATQNVDGLHQAAGSEGVIELHGSIRRVRCTSCDYQEVTDAALPDLPHCACGSLLRPDIVWFGEMLPPDALLRAERAAARGGVMLVIGTSAVVYPAAGLVHIAKSGGAFVIEVNERETEATSLAHAVLRGRAGEMMPDLVKRWVGE